MTEYELLKTGLEQICKNVDEQTIDNFLKFSNILLEKNKVMNLTAIKQTKEVITRHFFDSLMIKEDLIGSKKVIDIGTGAGFPGIPLAMVCKDTNFVLIDSIGKRIKFLNDVINEIGLKNVCAVHARAEEYSKDNREVFCSCISRAVADLSVLVELGLPFVKVGGKFIAMKAKDCESEVLNAKNAIKILGGEIKDIKTYNVIKSDITRSKVEILKIKQTEKKYPRKFSKISSQPLGGK